MTIVFLIIVLLWLAICSVWDLRHRELPLWITLAPYLLAAVYAAVSGQWPAAVLSILLIFLSDAPVLIRRTVSVILFFLILVLYPDPVGKWLCAAILGIWLLWDYFPAVLGGADARILISLSLLAMDARIVLVLFLGMGIVGMILKLFKGRPTPMIPGILMGCIAYVFLYRTTEILVFK